MGIAADLGYTCKPPNMVQRVSHATLALRPVTRAIAPVMTPMDRVLGRLSDGRASVAKLLGGIPVLYLTTTGRKSGLQRTSPLIAPPIGDTLALIGTNFGTTPTPSWVRNLEANPAGQVTYRDVTLDVVARPATEDERRQVWAAADRVYVGYGKYRERIQGRDIRIFVLERPTPQ